MRIAITMSHGLRPEDAKFPLPAEHFEALVGIAAELGFRSINYDDLERWYDHGATLPERSILFDFDHAVVTMLDVHAILDRYGYRGTLFIHTGPMGEGAEQVGRDPQYLTWDQVRSLQERGWLIGAHTVTHPNLSKLSREDPSGAQLRTELEQCDRVLERELGRRPRDFAYTGTSFSSAAEAEVRRRYRFGRLWITQSHYDADGQRVRYADLVGVAGGDEADGGPPMAARHITRQTPRYRLPAMEIQALIHSPQAFRRYLQGAGS